MEGQTLSHYRVLEKLGGGGMGVVYKALDTKLNRHVALKFLPPELTRDDDARERFMREAQAASALDHPNICTIHEIDNTPDGQLFIAMGYYEGETLKERVANGPLPIEEALDIAIQMAQGLAEAHAADIVHRDIKPANVMITKSGLVKIVDFGIAKLLGVTGPTQTGTTLGTVAYMSPEQVAGKDADQQSDVWSLGAVLYEMLTGQPAFKGENQWAVMNAITSHDPQLPSSLNAETSAEVQDLVLGALRKSKAVRYPSAAAFLDAAQASQRVPLGQTRGEELPSNVWRSVFRPKIVIPALAVLVIVSVVGVWSTGSDTDARWAREEALPEIIRLVETDDYAAAFSLAEEAGRHLPNDQLLADLWSQVSVPLTLRTTPSGVNAYIKPYESPSDDWIHLGRTPLDGSRISRGLHRLRLEQEGLETLDRVVTAFAPTELDVEVPRTGDIAEGMVPVPAQSLQLGLSGFDFQRLRFSAPAYALDRFEVTNREFQEFVDAGGYEDRRFWNHEFVKESRTLSWEEAMAEFRDSTGRPGPSSWQGGTYLEGRDDDPVTGVSWYEAAAYAEFVGKTLPSVYHWVAAAGVNIATPILAQSNFGDDGVASVALHEGMNRFGTYGMAGNAREWVWNEVGDTGRRYILGGAWSDPRYLFFEAAALPPFDRSTLNGFRCVRYPEREAVTNMLGPIPLPYRDFDPQLLASDEVFEAYRNSYSYDRAPLNQVEQIVPSGSQHWNRERVVIDAAYGDERFAINILLPTNVEPPYQTVMYFPGATAISMASFEEFNPARYDYVVMSGRALAFPVYDESFERNKDRVYSYPDDSPSHRDWTIRTVKDLMRALDYLETRSDLDLERLGYLGVSWGGRMAPIVLALEDRIKAGVLIVGGLTLARPFPETDPFHFAPRVSVPVLMVNGDEDIVFPPEEAQLPLYELLGTPSEHKNHVVLNGGHAIGATHRNQVVSEVLAWFDKYLGPLD